MGKIKLPKSLLRLLFPKKRKSTSNSSSSNTTTGSNSKAYPSHGGSGGSGVIPITGGSVEKASSPGFNYNYNNNIAVVEDDDDDDNTTNYTTEAEESILSLAPPLPPISLEELLQQGSATATTSSNQHYNDSDTEDEAEEDVILRPLKHTVDATTIQLDVDDDNATQHVITPPSSPGNCIVNTRNDTDVLELDDDSSSNTIIDINPATAATTIIHPDQNGGSSSLPSATTTTLIESEITETFQTPPIIFDPTTTTTTTSTMTKKKKSSSRVQFSLHGEEARQRAMARQRKILSKAHLRLDSISETSLEHIKEVTTSTACDGDDEDDDEAVVEEEEECILLLGDSSLGSSSSAAKSTKLKRHHRRLQQQQWNNDDVASSSASSVASIASSSYSWGRGKHRGNVSSYIFYESPTSPNNTNKKSSSSSPSPLEKSDVAPSMTSMMGDDEEEIGAVTDATKENICNYSATLATTTATTTNHYDNDASAVMQFFILLLCPTSRIFELLEINDYTTTTTNATTSTTIDETKSSVTTTTIQDILRHAIPKHCTDERLLLQKYIGLVRAEDKREFMELDAKAFFVPPPSSSEEGGEHRFIQRNDLLVAILEGYTGYQMAKISKPILRNTKFCAMIRRRCAAAGGGGGANPSSMVKSSGSRGESRPPLSSSKSRRNKKSDKNHRAARSAVSTGFKDDAYLSLCQQLKQLSKKLHIVDDEIAAEDDGMAASPVSPQANKRSDEMVEGGEGQVVAVIDSTAMTTPMKESNNNSFAKFKMTPKMVAYELAMNIEDIFADHDVEIVAVDADDDDDDDETTMAGLDGETIDADVEFDDRTTTDDDTFVSARSMRSLRSSRSMRSMLRKNENRSVIVADNDGDDDENNTKPVMEITTKRKDRKVGRTARGNRSMFDNYEEDDMMLQIEAMARQAESEFESRKKGAMEVSSAKFESVIDVKTNTKDDIAVQDLNAIVDDEIDVIPDIDGDDDADDDIVTSTPIPTHKSSSSSQSERDAMARSFLNASTTMVSTMVAASQGRVNEVHVLQYLGVTIVCIAANFMQQARSATAGGPMSPSSMGGGFGSGGGGGSGFGARDVLQSAMFLAFMVNGQRYMAKVTKK